MGMTCGLWRVQNSEIERLMADSDALEAFCTPNGPLSLQPPPED